MTNETQDIASEEPEEETPKRQVTYDRPVFHRRIFARIIDTLLLVLMFFVFFISVRAICLAAPKGRQAQETVRTIRLDSGLYREKDGDILSLNTYGDAVSAELSGSAALRLYSTGMEQFLDYLKTYGRENSYQTVSVSYHTYLVSDSHKDYKGFTYYVRNDAGDVVRNPDGVATDQMCANLIAAYVKDSAVPYLSSEVPAYYDATKVMSDLLFFVEIPISAVLASILVLYVPGLIFRRGRRSIGMLAYRIGQADGYLLSVSFWRYTAESAIRIFGVVLLSFATLGIPLIISFSLMAFSKRRQDFAQYMLNITELDLQGAKIYYSMAEAEVDQLENTKKSVLFTAKSRLDE